MCQDPGFDTLSRTFNEVKRIAGLDEDLDFRSSRSQFTSAEYAAVAKELGVRLLVGRTDSCHDKAVAESWFSMLKYEIQYRRRFTTRAHARFHVMQYIGCSTTAAGATPPRLPHPRERARRLPPSDRHRGLISKEAVTELDTAHTSTARSRQRRTSSPASSSSSCTVCWRRTRVQSRTRLPAEQ